MKFVPGDLLKRRDKSPWLSFVISSNSMTNFYYVMFVGPAATPYNHLEWISEGMINSLYKKIET